MAHAASRRSGLPGDETDDRLLHVGLDPFGGALFGVAADFADQNNGVRVRIVVEKLDGVEKCRANDGIAADADARGLADAELRQLMDGFVGERAAAADDADVALLVDAAGHDADFAFAGGDDARAVRNDEASFFVDEDAHRAPPARATTFWAPSFMPSAIVKFKPLSRRIFCPASTLVPSIRITTGTCKCNSFAAETTPVARTSQRRMPPKILMKTALTSGSLMRMRKAFLTCSAEAPPPTSRKLAGEPPAYLMMSMVAMARPAPLTMQATLPSSLM